MKLLAAVLAIWGGGFAYVAICVALGVWYLAVGPFLAWLYLTPPAVRLLEDIARHGLNNDR